MQIFRSLAGYSYGRADVVRRAMSKKKHDVMEQERETFIDGCAKNSISREVANGIFDKMTDFASYAFNKSHAACYALVAYRCAYLKRYHTANFMAALLTSVLDRSNKVAEYITECKRLGIRLAPPNINTSMKGFTASGDKIINYGMLGIKNLGSDFIEEIIAERKNGDFKDLADFCSRMQKGHFNRRAVESLIRCGAMDAFGANRKQMLQALPVLITNLEEKHRRTMYGQVGFFDISDDFAEDFKLPDVEEFSRAELLSMEKEMTGLYLSGHPMEKFEDYIERSHFSRTFNILEAGREPDAVKDGEAVNICGIITHITVKQTRANKANMAFITLEDMYGTIEAILFPNVFARYSSLIKEGSVIAINGTVSVEEEKDAKVLVNSVFKPQSNAAPKTAQRKKRKGLFLKFKSENDERMEKTKTITSIFDGTFPLYYYFEDTKSYRLQPKEAFVEPNNSMVAELKRILGDENVALIV